MANELREIRKVDVPVSSDPGWMDGRGDGFCSSFSLTFYHGNLRYPPKATTPNK